MRSVVQRVTRAKVTVDDNAVGEIKQGLVVFLGVRRDDSEVDADYLAAKIASLRVFDDEAGKMNRSVVEAKGAVLVVSQFTLYGDVRRGLRPSWIEAATPEAANALYEYFIAKISTLVAEVASGSFRSLMQVELVNDGPVTILLDSRKQF